MLSCSPARKDDPGPRIACRWAWRLAFLAGLGALAGCSPIETYRHWVGVSANDPNPETTPNTQNLAAGEALSYPNLATVPPPPSRALSSAELSALTQKLIADRSSAKYASEHLQAPSDATAAPPALPAPPLLPSTIEKTALAAPTAAATPPAASPSASAQTGAGGTPTRSARTPGAAKEARKPGQPPEPGPKESSLHSPEITSLPQPEQPQPAPSAPGTHLPAPPPAPPMPAAIGSAKFEPAPPPPKLPPAEPVHSAAAAGSRQSGKPAPPSPAFIKVADIAFAGDTTALGEAGRQVLSQVLTRYRAKPGLVRVVGYAALGKTAAEKLTSYQTALDRAQAVAAGLSKAGIPASKIQTEASPTPAGVDQGRAEILFAQ